MAGGNYLMMNKKLPGAYLNFQSVPQASGNISDRGVATMPLQLEWGPNDTVIELFSTDLTDGKSLPKVGTTAFYGDSLILRECLKHCYKLLVWRIDTGAVKAKADVGDLVATAKYGGQKGNFVQVAVITHASKADTFEVVTYFEQTEKDRQSITAIDQLISNDWVDFSGTGSITASAGVHLQGGVSGTVKSSDYSAYLNAMKLLSWNTMGIPSNDTTLVPIIKTYIEDLRNKQGKKVQAVVYNDNTADFEGIISCKQGYATALEEITPLMFVAWVTGATAGAGVNKSLCYKLLDGAERIIGDLSEDMLAEEIQKGWFLLGKRVDDKVVVLDDLNTFVSYTSEKDVDFANNRVIRVLDDIGSTTQLQFEKNYIGKVDNTETGREIFKSQLIANFGALQDINAIQNFKAEDLEVLPGEGKADVKVNAYIQPADCMKKLYMTVFER